MKNKIWRAYEIQSYIEAGLTMTELNGKLDWMGTSEQFRQAGVLLNYYESFAV